MDSREERQASYDLGFGPGQDREARLDIPELVVNRGELAEHVRVPSLGFGELPVEAGELGVTKVLREKLESFPGTSLDEPQQKEPVREAAFVRAGERKELLRIGIPFVATQASAARKESLVDHTKVLELLDGESAQTSNELVVRGIGDDERKRGCGGLLLTVGVVVEERVQIGHRDLDPTGIGRGHEHT